MSKITDMVEAETTEHNDDEADERDAEPVEPAEGVEDADEGEVGEPEGSVDTKALEGALGRHEKAMRKVLGDAFDDMKVCPTCDGFSFVPDDVEPQPEPVRSPLYERCASCNGYGQVLTGALVDASPLTTCVDCQGGGYVTKPIELPAASYAPPLPGNGEPIALPRAPQLVIDPAQVEAMRAAGYTIIDPYVPAGGAA